VLFVTHDVDEAIYLADRIYIMCAGPGTIVEDLRSIRTPREAAMKQTKEFHDMQQHVLACLRRAPGHGQIRVTL